MPIYDTQKFTWGVRTSTYGVDMGSNAIETDEDNNLMFDFEGKFIKNWYGAGGRWGIGITPMGGDRYEDRLPKTLNIAYYDYMDETFYRLNTELPTDKIYDLFKQKSVMKGPQQAGETIDRYNELVFGIGPKGYIMVWAASEWGNEQIEIGQYWASKRTDMTIEKYNNPTDKVQRGFPILERWLVLDDFPTGLEKSTIAKLKAGWTPTPEYYQMQRVKYPWRYTMTGNAQLLEYSDRLGNQEKHMVFARELAQKNAQVKGIPQFAWLFFNDKQGKRRSVEFTLYNKKRVSGEPDLSQVWDAIHKLFPNRKVEDNDALVDAADFANLEVNVSDDGQSIQVALVKGNVRIPLKVYEVDFDDLEPDAYFTDSPPLTPAQREKLRNGPQAKATVKVNDVCPKTGFWRCPQLAYDSTIFMRQGDVMPGKSYAHEGMNVAEMYWEWVKDA